jgi:TPR repeat protein
LAGSGVEKDPIEAVAWFRKAAEQGDAYGQRHLGICLAQGLGVTKDYSEARKWLTLAAGQNDPKARYQLRLLWFRKHSILKWRNRVIAAIGSALLVFHAWNKPIVIHGFAVMAFLAIVAVSGLAVVLFMAVLEKLGLKGSDEKETQFLKDSIDSAVKKKPLQLLLIPTEDGFFLLPLLYIGITPISAAIAAVLFAAAHYPLFPWRYCLPKGIAYFFVALFVLPLGIWSVVLAHMIIDLTLVIISLLFDAEDKAIWRRLLRALRTN